MRAGMREFTHSDYAQVSTERIAERAGVAQGLLFHYFKTKRNFWEAVMARVLDEQEAAFAANTHRDPARWLREELELFLFGLAEYPPGLIKAGSAEATDHLAIIDARQERAASRLLWRMGVAEPSPLLHVAIRGWVGLALSAGSDWLRRPAVSRAQILTLLTHTLHRTLEQVAEMQPGAVDPGFFRPGSTSQH